MTAIIERVERALDAAAEWKAARVAVLEIAASHPEYMTRLNRLSEAEDRLSSLLAELDRETRG